MIPKNRRPRHPGEILLLEFLRPMGISQTKLANDLDIPMVRENAMTSASSNVNPSVPPKLEQ
jgi:addiction module HigA family antidote